MPHIRRLLRITAAAPDAESTVTDEDTRQEVAERLERQRARVAALDGRVQVQTAAKRG